MKTELSAPDIPKLRFRNFQDEDDYYLIKEIFDRCMEVDPIERAVSIEDIAHTFDHLTNCDPSRDMLLAEIDDQPVAWTRVWWSKEIAGTHIYHSMCWLAPDWRRKGIGTAILEWNETRLREIASDHTLETDRFFRSSTDDEIEGAGVLLRSAGYEPARRFFKMVRKIDAPLPDAPMPDGLDIRPVEESHLRKIWRAANEAFQDNWGEVEMGEESFQRYLSNPKCNPSLWKVAWDGDEVAGMVLNFVDETANKAYNIQRGWTEDISVRKPWRRRGLATALIVQSIEMFRVMGFEETALGVDTENDSGALNIYERIGYRTTASKTVYQKSME